MSYSESRIIETKILGNDKIAEGIYRLTLDYTLSHLDIKPGQFVNLYLNDKSMILPRPVSICEIEGDRLTLVYRVVGKGTEVLSGYQPGELIRVSTPLGNGYDVDDVMQCLENTSGKSIVLASGGIGVAPMLELAKSLRREIKEDTELIAAIGFQDEVFLKGELECYCDKVLVATENGLCGHKGNVLELIKSFGPIAAYYLACGPKAMLKALTEYCGENKSPIQVSLEERMGCGYGACVGCSCKIHETNENGVEIKLKKVCKDGPVFRGNEVVWNDALS